jgi:hypothetical protein
VAEEIILPLSLLQRVDAEDSDASSSTSSHGNSDYDSDISDSDIEMTDTEDSEHSEDATVVFNQSVFEVLYAGRLQPGIFEDRNLESPQAFRYQRRSEPSLRTVQRKERSTKEMQSSAEGSRKIYTYFQPPASQPEATTSSTTESGKVWLSSDQRRSLEREAAIKALDKKIYHKSHTLNKQSLIRHQAVLAFLRAQQGKQLGETRESMARMVARCFGKTPGIYFARKIESWEIEWMSSRSIPEGQRGCFVKVKSWFHDEGVQAAVREWIAENPADKITVYGLAKAVGTYLDSKRATIAVEKILQFGPGGNRIRARTARRWLNQLGLVHGRYTKGVYVDGHEREDVVFYRKEVFLPRWNSLKRRMVIFAEDGTWSPPPGLLPGEKPLVLVTHDESTFSANDGKRQGWMKKGQQPLRQKSKGKGIKVSGFLTPGGKLEVPTSICNAELERNPMWVKVNDQPIRDSMWLHEYGKDNYWTGEKMVWQTLRIAMPIFQYAFPECQALFAFDNASNHCCFTEDALISSNVSLNPGGRQPRMREGFDHRRGLPHPLVFSDNHPNFSLRGKAKGAEAILREHGL